MVHADPAAGNRSVEVASARDVSEILAPASSFLLALFVEKEFGRVAERVQRTGHARVEGPAQAAVFGVEG